VRIVSELRGTRVPPVHRPLPPIALRFGVDRNPVDLTDDASVRWLRACIWPGQHDRRGRLDAAIELARIDPPEVWAGDLVDRLDDALERVPADLPVCLLSTWVFAYVPSARRRELQERIQAAARRRPIASLTADYEVTVPWLPPAPRRPSIDNGDVPTRLALTLWEPEPRSVTLGWMHSHGLWFDWIDDA
jgi:hypothetical protein